MCACVNSCEQAHPCVSIGEYACKVRINPRCLKPGPRMEADGSQLRAGDAFPLLLWPQGVAVFGRQRSLSSWGVPGEPAQCQCGRFWKACSRHCSDAVAGVLLGLLPHSPAARLLGAVGRVGAHLSPLFPGCRPRLGKGWMSTPGGTRALVLRSAGRTLPPCCQDRLQPAAPSWHGWARAAGEVLRRACPQDLCERHEKGVLHKQQRALHKYSLMKRQVSAAAQSREPEAVEQLESRIVEVGRAACAPPTASACRGLGSWWVPGWPAGPGTEGGSSPCSRRVRSRPWSCGTTSHCTACTRRRSWSTSTCPSPPTSSEPSSTPRSRATRR